MEEKNYTSLIVTFKNGESVIYNSKNGEWDDYAFTGNAVIIKYHGAWVGIYNFDCVQSVQLK